VPSKLMEAVPAFRADQRAEWSARCRTRRTNVQIVTRNMERIRLGGSRDGGDRAGHERPCQPH